MRQGGQKEPAQRDCWLKRYNREIETVTAIVPNIEGLSGRRQAKRGVSQKEKKNHVPKDQQFSFSRSNTYQVLAYRVHTYYIYMCVCCWCCSSAHEI